MPDEFAIRLGNIDYLICLSTWGIDYGTRVSWRIVPIYHDKDIPKVYNEELSNAVDLLNKGHNYAGLSPKDFVAKMTGGKLIPWNGEL